MTKILHFIPDEKVTDQIIEIFTVINKDNVFFVFKKSKDAYKYTKNIKENVIGFSYDLHKINNIIDTHKFKAIIVHGMRLEFAKIILEIKTEISIGWVAWGFDIYGLPKIQPSLYAFKTNSFLLKSDKILFIKRFIKKYNFLRKIYFKNLLKREDYNTIILRAIEKVKYFCSYVEEDFNFFSLYYPNRLKFLYAAFNSIDQYLAGNNNLIIFDDAVNILVGNSNTPECNHIDVFDQLSLFKEVSNLIYVPLSYGDDEKYKHAVINHGNKQFGNRFVPMLDFMDRVKYINILQSCSVGVFYHYRQQAMGNIIAMLYMGSRIYLSSRNPAYQYLKKNGILVFDFDKDFKIYSNSKLNMVDIEKNRKILNSIFSAEKVEKDLMRLSDILIGT
jgi:dTDP-N-acetylfucosamine:lipid II N-acetylfucosaminyltransferase